MCGICGSCSTDKGTRLSEQTVREMADSIAHRGPDGDGFFVDDNVVLGHRRLSIIDLHTGDQPMSSSDGSIIVVFNGEIYNYKEIRAQLIERGHVFQTQSDTEVLIHLYKEKGTDLVDDLNGMFAFAIWDPARKIFFAARDRMGEKPFYYQPAADGSIHFSSELKALLKPKGRTPELSTSALQDYLSYGYVPAPATIFSGIFKLAAAHRLIWNNGNITVERYWSPDASQVDTSMSEPDALAELTSLLEDSVRLRLRSDVPVGAFLSGGIDSSLIVGLASKLLDSPLQTFVIGFDEERFDESKHAAKVANIFGTDHHEITVSDMSLDILPQLVRQFDEPFADPSSLPTYYVTRAAGDALKVCLSGDGADELFGGYTRYFSSRFETAMRNVPLSIRRPLLGGLANTLPMSIPGVGFLERLSKDGADHYQQKVGLFGATERRAMIRPEQFASANEESTRWRRYFTDVRYSDQEARLRTDQETYLPEDILVKVDRNAMLNSLEVRVPFIDHRLVDFANTVPMHHKNRNGQGKYLLRQLLGELLPENLINRPKQGFSVPISDWFRTDYSAQLKEQLLAPDARIRAYLQNDYVQKLYETHQSGRRDRSHQLWALLWLEIWLAEYCA